MYNFNQQNNLYAMPNGYFDYDQVTNPMTTIGNNPYMPQSMNPMINNINPYMPQSMNSMINPMMNNTNQYMNQQMATPYMTPQNLYAHNPTMTTSINVEGVNGQIQVTPNFIQNGYQNLDSVKELKKKLEKSQVLRKECEDFTFIISNTGGIYIFFKRNNEEWIEKFPRKLWANMKSELICENKVVFIPLTYLNIDKNITDEEIIYFLTKKIQTNFFIKKINKDDYLKINGQILCINSDNLLEKIETYGYSYFLKTPETNQLIQDFNLGINDDSYLFIDEKTKKTYSYDLLPRLKELENHLEEVKNYVG